MKRHTERSRSMALFLWAADTLICPLVLTCCQVSPPDSRRIQQNKVIARVIFDPWQSRRKWPADVLDCLMPVESSAP